MSCLASPCRCVRPSSSLIVAFLDRLPSGSVICERFETLRFVKKCESTSSEIFKLKCFVQERLKTCKLSKYKLYQAYFKKNRYISNCCNWYLAVLNLVLCITLQYISLRTIGPFQTAVGRHYLYCSCVRKVKHNCKLSCCAASV